MTDAYLLIPDTAFVFVAPDYTSIYRELLVTHLTLYAGPTVLDFSS